MERIKKIKLFLTNRNLFAIIISIAAIYVASIPLFDMIIIKTDDVNNFFTIISEMKSNILTYHQFPYRINPGTLYGGQIPIFYHLTILYIYFIFNIILKFNEAISYNLFLILFNILSFYTMYIASKKISKNKNVALVSAIMYELCVYRLIDIYRRGALGEIISFAFIPLLILSLYEIFFDNIDKNDKNQYFVKDINNTYGFLFLFSTTVILQDHMITTYLYFLIIVIFLIVTAIMNRKVIDYRKRYLYFIKFSVFSFLLNSWYIFPIIYEFLFVDYINPAFLNGIGKFTYPTSINDFFSIFTNYSKYSQLGLQYTFSIILCLIILFIIKFYKKNVSFKDYFCIILFIVSLIVYLLTFDFIPLDKTEISFIKKVTQVLQFRFRLFLIAVPFISISVPYIVSLLINNKTIKKILFFILILFSFISSISYIGSVNSEKKFNFVPIYIWNRDYFLTGTKSQNEFDYNFKAIVYNEDLRISNEVYKNNYCYLDYKALNNGSDYYIDLPLFNYPVYKAYDENKNELKIENGENNLIRININKPKGSIEVVYKEPLFWQIGNVISLIFIIYLLFSVIFRKKFKT